MCDPAADRASLYGGESARITEINQSYMDYSKTEINKFISGERSFEDWDAFVQELISKGAQERVDIANQAEQRFAKGE